MTKQSFFTLCALQFGPVNSTVTAEVVADRGRVELRYTNQGDFVALSRTLYQPWVASPGRVLAKLAIYQRWLAEYLEWRARRRSPQPDRPLISILPDPTHVFMPPAPPPTAQLSSHFAPLDWHSVAGTGGTYEGRLHGDIIVTVSRESHAWHAQFYLLNTVRPIGCVNRWSGDWAVDAVMRLAEQMHQEIIRRFLAPTLSITEPKGPALRDLDLGLIEDASDD